MFNLLKKIFKFLFYYFLLHYPRISQDIKNPIQEYKEIKWNEYNKLETCTYQNSNYNSNFNFNYNENPNIILIIADDLGYSDVKYMNSLKYMRDEGLEYTNNYAGQFTCALSRAAILTGINPLKYGFEFTPAPSKMAKIIGLYEDGLNVPILLNEENLKSDIDITEKVLPKSLNIANCANNPLITKPKCSKFTIILNYSLDMKKASIMDKVIMIENKMIYGAYIVGKYFVHKVGYSIKKCTNSFL